MNGKSRPFKGAAPETPAKASVYKITPTVAEMQGRRSASRRLLALADGRRDPMDRQAIGAVSLAGSRAAWRHLRAHGLDNLDTTTVLLSVVTE